MHSYLNQSVFKVYFQPTLIIEKGKSTVQFLLKIDHLTLNEMEMIQVCNESQLFKLQASIDISTGDQLHRRMLKTTSSSFMICESSNSVKYTMNV